MSEKFDFLTKEQNLLISVLAEALFPQGETISSEDVDFLKLWNEAQLQTVSVLVFNKMPLLSFSAEAVSFIRNNLNNWFLKNILIAREHIHLDKMLKNAQIPYVILKGMASARFYPDDLMRMMGDVDFLVKECDIERVDKLLTADSYVARKKEHSHHITYTKNGIRAEMHFLPPGIPEGKTGERIKGYFENITDEARDAKTSVGSICVPSDFHHGMLLLLHTIHHLTGDGLGFRHLCDWAVFVSSFKEAEFRALFEEKLKSVGMWEFAKILTKACGMFLGAPCVLSENDADEDICKRLILDIFSSGNFGQKSEDRSHESLLISSKNEKGVEEKSLVAQGLKSVNSIVYRNWPFVRKYKLLLPVGWLFFCGRYIFRSIRGKRPSIHLKNVFSQAQQRKDFYSELKLFETET